MPEYSILLNFESKISLEENFSLIAPVWFSFFDSLMSNVQMKSKHTSMWIIHIKWKCFFWEEKRLLVQEKEKRIYK